MRVAAVVPALNEEGSIAAVVEGVRPFVAAVIVVDDGSSDATGVRAQGAGADVIAHPVTLGKGCAVRAGLASVLAGDYTHVLLLDGDMQHLPQEASRLLEAAVRTDADVVLGERQFNREAMPASRYHTNTIGSRALSSFVGLPIRDTQCGYRLFKLDLLRRIRLRATSYDIETEMLIKAGRSGARIVSVPVTAVYSGQRSKLRPIRDTTRTCFLAVYYRYVERV